MQAYEKDAKPRYTKVNGKMTKIKGQKIEEVGYQVLQWLSSRKKRKRAMKTIQD